MKTWKKVALAVCVLLVVACHRDDNNDQPDLSNQPILPKKELRGVWMATVWGLDWPQGEYDAEAQKASYIAYMDLFKQNNTNAVFVPYLLTIVYLFVSELYTKANDPINNWAYTMLGQMYIALPLSMINVLAFRQADNQIYFYHLLPLSVFIFLWTNDTGAYCSGSLFGKHKLFPRISPAKSWEGSIGGGILVLLVAALIGYLETQSTAPTNLTIPQWLGLGLVVVVFGTWGDLVESLFKRTLGIKDSGNILPGHGGMLDRFDSSLMAIPASVVYLYSLTLFQ